MQRATGLTTPFLLVTLYYAGLAVLLWLLLNLFPAVKPFLSVGAIEAVMSPPKDFQEVFETAPLAVLNNLWTLALAIIAAIALMVPVSWVYLLTHSPKEIESSFIQTMMILPVIVAGIAMIVQNSIALAFSLAGIVAAVRFRFALDKPAHALYIFSAITVGLGAGISALEVAAVVSTAFVYLSMLLWKLDYGDYLDGSFLRLFTGRHSDD
jgi:hypothetical protein